MSWQELLGKRLAERHRTSKEELNALRAVAERNLRDARVQAVSADSRFAAAYEAALTLATMAIATAGYRIKGPGHHRTIFEVLHIAMPGPQTAVDARYFDRCRRLRNRLSYEQADVVTERDVEELLTRVTAFGDQVEHFLASRRPNSE